MSERPKRAPVSGTCQACGCPLGFVSCQRDDVWYCCGACAGSRRRTCGCNPELERDGPSDAWVPGRRMFASRRPDELKTPADYRDRNRAFPFSDRKRGR